MAHLTDVALAPTCSHGAARTSFQFLAPCHIKRGHRALQFPSTCSPGGPLPEISQEDLQVPQRAGSPVGEGSPLQFKAQNDFCSVCTLEVASGPCYRSQR